MPSVESLLRLAIVVIAVVALAGCNAGEQRPASPMAVPALSPARSVSFLPIGDFSSSEIDGLVSHYFDKFGMSIGVMPPMHIPTAARDQARGQVIAEQLLGTIAALPLATNQSIIVIGLLKDDMYTTSQDWRYTYSLRAAGHLAVVSTARLDDGLMANPIRRLQKLVTKSIGLMYFGLPLSDDPGSVLYRNILGPQDLDRMSEEF
jgi:hypothetical protein